MVQPLWKTLWQFLIKLNMQLPYDPVIILSGIYAREMKTFVRIKACITNIHRNFMYINQKLETKMSFLG